MADRFAAFRHVSYRNYFFGRLLRSLGLQILIVSASWQIWDTTKQVVWLGWIGLMQFLPALALVLVTGLAADRLGRKQVMSVTMAIEGLCVLAVLGLTLTGNFRPIPVLAVLTLFGVARAFYSPASQSLAVNLVPKEDVPNAVSWITSSWQIASILGPSLGGLIYALSPVAAYSTAAVCYVAALILILIIPKLAPPVREPTTMKTILGGFEYIWREKLVLGAISLDLFAVLLGGAVALLPVYASDILHLNSMGNGLLRAAPGVGAMIVAVGLTGLPIRKHAGLILFFSVAMFGAATAVFGASKLAWLSILALMLIGAFDMISVYVREILMQMWTPDHVRGRVNAVNSIFIGASNELGEARAGFMAAALGPVVTVVSGGLAAVAIAGIWAALFPQLRRAQSIAEGPATK